jgi:hypothetical protein
MVCAVSFTAVACNTKHSASSDSSGTTTARLHIPSSTTTVAGHSGSTTTTTIPFSQEIDDVRDELEAASGNLCEMVAATRKDLHVTPVNATEVKQAIDLFVQMIHDMSTVATASDGAIYKATASELEVDAKKANYSVTWFSSAKSSEALNDQNFVAATSRLETKYQATCSPG